MAPQKALQVPNNSSLGSITSATVNIFISTYYFLYHQPLKAKWEDIKTEMILVTFGF